MRRVTIHKGTKVRVTYSPNPKERERLAVLLPIIAKAERDAAWKAGTQAVSHGFIKNRNPVTCAMPHRGFKITVSCDLAGWFDSVRAEQIPLSPEIVAQITYEGAPRQGLSTSPSACNLAAIPMDRKILDMLTAVFPDKRFAFTRYADDLTVSFDDTNCEPIVLGILRDAATAMGWQLAEHKTRIQRAKAGRRIIVGIAVDDRINATRKARRKLRAAKHGHHRKGINIHNSQSAAGLSEWVSCKLPRAARGKRQIVGAMAGGGSSSPVIPDNSPTTASVSTTGGRRVLIAKPAERSANE